jgi:PilZ domain
MLERRKCSRELTLKTGKLYMPGSSVRVDCAILDISDDGACILVPNDADIPTTFSLTMDRIEITVGCQLRWKARNRIGVSFDRPVGRSIANQSQSQQEADQSVLSHDK